MTNSYIKAHKIFPLALALGLVIVFPKNTYAFIPYIYEPKIENLKNTGISIAKTAVQLLELGETKEAARLAALAVRLNPNDDRLWAIMAETQLRRNLLNEAEKSLRKAKTINPKKAAIWFREGSLKLQQNKPKQAINSINEGLKIEPKNAGAYSQLGNAFLMENKFQSALQSFQQATEIKPKFWETLNTQGLALFEMQKTEKAIKRWRDVLKITKNAEPMLALAAALNKKQEKPSEILKLAKQALASNPNYVSTQFQKEQLWGSRLLNAAERLLTKPELKSDVEQALANSNLNTD